LDAYKQEQEQGKDLIADQLAAVAKYGEVMHCLEFARDLSKQITQMQVETSRVVKKQTKREQVERALAEAERSKELMILTNWLQRLVRDFTYPVPVTKSYVHAFLFHAL